MHDARPRHLRELRVEMQQRVLQGAGRVAGAWMHDQPGGLVDHEDVAVLVDDVQLDLFRRDPDGLLRRLRADLDVLAAQNLVLGSQLLAVDEHLAGLDPFLDAGAGKVAQQLGQHLIQALAGVFDGNGERALDGVRTWGLGQDRRNLSDEPADKERTRLYSPALPDARTALGNDRRKWRRILACASLF